MIILSSFFKRDEEYPENVAFSAAVYQPKGFKFEKVAWTDIRDERGRWTRPREFLDYLDPVVAYRDALWTVYLQRDAAIQAWLYDWNKEDPVLCCWCPYDSAAKRQIKEWGSYICHTAVIGKFLQHRYQIDVEYDKDRDKMVKW